MRRCVNCYYKLWSAGLESITVYYYDPVDYATVPHTFTYMCKCQRRWMFALKWSVQSTLPYVVGHVSQFQLSQSYGPDRLLESAQFDSVTSSCAADSGRWLFFRCFFSFEMQNNSSQPKNEKSTARKTRPTLVEKMAMLEEIKAGVSRWVFVLVAVSWSVNQSIDRSIDLSLTEKCQKFN